MPPSIDSRNGDGLSTNCGLGSGVSSKKEDTSDKKMSSWDAKRMKDQDNIQNRHEMESRKPSEFLPSTGMVKKTASMFDSPKKKTWNPTPTDENRRSGEWIGGSPSMGPNKIRRSWTVKKEIVTPDLSSSGNSTAIPSSAATPIGSVEYAIPSKAFEDDGSPAASSIDTSKTKTLKANLSFLPDLVSHVETIPHHESFSPEEHTLLWYDSKEVEKIHKECAETVRKMHAGEPLVEDDPESTTRGLEYMTPNGFDITTSSLEVVQAVLEEQERQRKEALENGSASGEKFVLDDELLADVSEGVSRHRSRIAHLAAMKDERAIAFELQKLLSQDSSNSGWGGSSPVESGSDGDGGSVWNKAGEAGDNSTGSIWDKPAEAGNSGGSVWNKPADAGGNSVWDNRKLVPLGVPLGAQVVSTGLTKSRSFGPTSVPLRRGPPERRSLRNSNSFGELADKVGRTRRSSGGEGREGSKSPGRLRRRQRSQRLIASAVAASVEQASAVANAVEGDSQPAATTADDPNAAAKARASLRRSRRSARGSRTRGTGEDMSPHRQGSGTGSMSPPRSPNSNSNNLPPVSPRRKASHSPTRAGSSRSLTEAPPSSGSLGRRRVTRNSSGNVSAVSLAAAVADTPSYEPSEPVSAS